jgi:arylsulfatase A-like enzyme
VRLRAATAWTLVLALPNQVAIGLRSERSDVVHWLSHHALDAGQLLALGLGSGALAEWLHRRFPTRPWLKFLVLVVGSLLLGAHELPTSFEGFAERSSERAPYALLLWGLVLLTALGPPLATWVGSKCRNRWLGVPALVAAFALASLNNFVLDQDYFGLHVFITLTAFGLGSATLHALRPRWLERPSPRRTARIALGVCGAFALAAVVFPSNRMMLRLSSLEGAPLARLSASARVFVAGKEDTRSVVEALSPERKRWFDGTREPVPPSAALLPQNPIVILLTIDCMRADVFDNDRKNPLSYFEGLSKTSVHFEQARSAGSATVPSLSAIFAGRYYSQIVWTKRSKGGDVWPNEDDGVRFPELLQRAGIPTATVASKAWLTNERGVVRGFDEETDLDRNRKPRTNHVKLKEIIPLLQERLERANGSPLFFYAHVMDPHSPYDTGKRKGKPFDRFVSEIDQVGSRLQKLDEWLRKKGLFDRTTLIVTADHGEAFGEHATWQHSKTVYEELIRVPLWIRVPGVEPKRVAHPVSLIDLGPTILDLFGQPTPATFMGQSLVPLLTGERSLTRPIAAEGRLIQTMIFPDGKKAIYDQRRGTHELYDLAKDPKELENLAEDGSNEHSRLLRAFFQKHQHPIYPDRAPYRN